MKKMVYIIFTLFTFVWLTACTKADLSSKDLGLKLQAALTVDKSQNNSNNGSENPHIVTGTCPTSVVKMQININKSNWQDITQAQFMSPANGETATSTVPASTEWSTDCSVTAGRYKFWIWNSQLGSQQPTSVMIKGLTKDNKETNSLELVDNQVPSSIQVQMTNYNHPGAAAFSSCAPISVYLKSSSGSNAQSSSVTNFSMTISNAGSAGIGHLYGDMNSCTTNGPSNTNFLSMSSLSIPANANYMQYYYYVNDPVGTNLTVQITSSSYPTSGGSQSFSVKNPTDLWLRLNLPDSIVAGVCYPVTVDLMNYNDVQAMNGGMMRILNLSGITGMNLYSNTSCTTNLSTNTWTIPVSVSTSGVVYVKASTVSPNLSNTNGTLQVNDTSSATPVADPGSRWIYIDDSNYGTATAYTIKWSQDHLIFGNCYTYNVMMVNAHSVPIPSTSATSVTLSGPGTYYADLSSCNAGTSAITSTGLAAMQYMTSQIAYKPNSTTGSYNLQFTSTSPVLSGSYAVSVANAITAAASCNTAGGNYVLINSSCSVNVSGGFPPYMYNISPSMMSYASITSTSTTSFNFITNSMSTNVPVNISDSYNNSIFTVPSFNIQMPFTSASLSPSPGSATVSGSVGGTVTYSVPTFYGIPPYHGEILSGPLTANNNIPGSGNSVTFTVPTLTTPGTVNVNICDAINACQSSNFVVQ